MILAPWLELLHRADKRPSFICKHAFYFLAVTLGYDIFPIYQNCRCSPWIITVIVVSPVWRSMRSCAWNRAHFFWWIPSLPWSMNTAARECQVLLGQNQRPGRASALDDPDILMWNAGWVVWYLGMIDWSKLCLKHSLGFLSCCDASGSRDILESGDDHPCKPRDFTQESGRNCSRRPES